jgi:hypothetical protein
VDLEPHPAAMPSSLDPGAVGLPGGTDHLDPPPSAGFGWPTVEKRGLPEVLGRVQHTVEPAERLGEPRHPRRQPAPQWTIAFARSVAAGILTFTSGRAESIGTAGDRLVVEQALQDFQRRVERGHGRTLNPVVVPSAVGEAVLEEPTREPGNVGAELCRPGPGCPGRRTAPPGGPRRLVRLRARRHTPVAAPR